MWELPRLTPEEILMYLRKSRTDDPALSVSEVLSKHETILNEWTERNFPGQAIPEGNRFREVISGETIEERKEVQKVLRLIENPKYKAVLVVEPQRLSRGDLEDVGRIMKLFRYTNTLILTPQKYYDLKDEYDRDALERELKRGNEFLEYQKKIMRRGRELAVSQGDYIGNVAPYGYKKAIVLVGKKKCHTLEPDPQEAPIVKMIFEMYVNQDLGRFSIAKKLNEMGVRTRRGGLWSQDSIKTILENEHYIGKVRWNRKKTVYIVEDGEVRKSRPHSKDYTLCDGKHQAIISDELFYAAKEKAGRNHRAKSTTKVRNPLAGLLYCQCGRAMSLRTYKRNGVERSAPRLLCDNQAYCGTSSVLFSDMILRVKEVLKKQIEDFELQISSNDSNSRELQEQLIARLENQLKELERKEISQWEKYSEEGMPKQIFAQLNEKVLHEKEIVQHALLEAKDTLPAPSDYYEKIAKFQAALDALEDPNMSAEKKNLLLKECIQRIAYNREKVERLRREPGEKKGTTIKTPGGHWSSTPIQLNFELRI